MTSENINNGAESSEEELSKAVDEALAQVTADVSNEVNEVVSLTADLQRLTAEYANYRKRVDRDRIADREVIFASVMNELLPILDNIDLAAQHGELQGGFKAVADQLATVTSKLGLKIGRAHV